jgi:hypothetical protein
MFGGSLSEVSWCSGFVADGAFCATAQQPSSPWLTDAERARFEELRRSGLDALYNIDYDKAQRDFKEIVQLYPNHPGGYQLLAARVWIKTLYESRRLQVSLYSSNRSIQTATTKSIRRS